MFGQQHHGRSQQLSHLGGLVPALRKAQMQRQMPPALGTKRLGQLTDQALGFVMQYPRQPPTGVVPGSRQAGQGGERRYTPKSGLA